jgi:predicted AlkP superfamily phosphohydrolase/phosphomutase
MAKRNNSQIDRRKFLQMTSATIAVGLVATSKEAFAKNENKKVIVIGVDGMDPFLTESMMDQGRLPNFSALAEAGGYRRLGTSTPPQSPVAWANFINGAGPGSHGIFDFIHRNPEKQAAPFFSAAETLAGSGYWEVGDHKLQIPLLHKAPETMLRREGTPFWDYLDKAGISSTFYDLPSNYPASESKYGNHKCLSGMGTPDLLGTYSTYQHYAEDGPVRPIDKGGGRQSMLFFENETANGSLIGPPNTMLKKPEPVEIEFTVHRDTKAGSAVIDIQGQRILLKAGQWSNWVKLEYRLKMPKLLPDTKIRGICRFYLQEVSPNFRLYVTPINADPSKPIAKLTEPKKFIKNISSKLGLFYTTGFQEDYKALSHKVFSDDEFVTQAQYVLDERLTLLEYAMENYDDGLLFFYFSSTDVQAHMLWWDTEDKHPYRSKDEAKKYFEHFKGIYEKMDETIGRIVNKYGDQATIMVMSDHGFANFKRQFNINAWLRENGYIGPDSSTSIMTDIDWSQTRAYGLGINGLYVNLKGRERNGIIEPGPQYEQLLEELIMKLEAVQDTNGKYIIKKVHRADKIYKGNETKFAPDLIIGFKRGYRASWDTILGGMDESVLSDNNNAWAADHCIDPSEVPGILFCNRPVAMESPSLIDLAPTILTEFGLDTPESMEGKDIFS